MHLLVFFFSVIVRQYLQFNSTVLYFYILHIHKRQWWNSQHPRPFWKVMNGLHVVFHTPLSSSVILYCSYIMLFLPFQKCLVFDWNLSCNDTFCQLGSILFWLTSSFSVFQTVPQRQEKQKVQRPSSKRAVKIGTSNMAPSVAGYLATLIRNIIKLWQMAAAPQRIQPVLCAYECDINRNVEII